jgi:predicted RecA/RadA family phage recombinase
MKNIISNGKTVDVTLSGAKSSGDFHVEGATLGGVLSNGGVSGDVVSMRINGVFSLPKETPLVMTKGDKLYWVSGNSNFNKTSTGNKLRGICMKDASSGDAFVELLLINIGA